MRGLLRAWWARIRLEVVLIFRDRTTITFTIVLPFILLLTLSSLIHSHGLPQGVSFAQYLTAGMVASGLVYGGFQGLSTALPDERTNGTLKRLYGSPMPPSAYFAGKVGGVLVIYVCQMALMLTLGGVAFHVHLPTGQGQLVTFLWLSALALVTFTSLGIAFSSLAKTGQAAAAIATPLVLFLQFSSGVFFIYSQEPAWMRFIASLFPLRWLCQGMRSVFLPASYGSHEVAGGFHLPQVALVMAAWSIGGLILCRRTFRWLPIGEG
ncbi:MAG TPA: ABC transporter permease [Acidimicrobiales bacterium]|nr:ABC transporter permease [Acidimicrobiales bacterium]